MGDLNKIGDAFRALGQAATTINEGLKTYDKIKDSPLGKKLNEQFGGGKRPEGAEVSKPEDIAAVLNAQPQGKSIGGFSLPSLKKTKEEDKLGVTFKVEPIDLGDGKPPLKILTADLTPQQSTNITKVLGELSAEEKKKLFGTMSVSSVAADPAGNPPTPAALVIDNPAQVPKGEAEGFMKDARKEAIKLALSTGDANAVREKLGIPKKEAPAEEKTSAAPADLDVARVAAGLKGHVQGGPVQVASSSAATLGGGGTKEVTSGGLGTA